MDYGLYLWSNTRHGFSQRTAGSNNSLWLALVAFNVGVEAAQMAIVIVYVPLAYWLRR